MDKNSAELLRYILLIGEETTDVCLRVSVC